MLSLNKSYKNRKVSLTIHWKYKYFDSTIQRSEDRRQEFYFWRLPFAENVKLNFPILDIFELEIVYSLNFLITIDLSNAKSLCLLP